MNTQHVLAIPEILENIFTFLNRNDLYKSCNRVNHQWNAVSTSLIRKKRTKDFINIPGIRDNIFNHLFLKINPLVCRLWNTEYNYNFDKLMFLDDLNVYHWGLTSYHPSFSNRKRTSIHLRRFKKLMKNCPDVLKHDRDIVKIYHETLDGIIIQIEYLRLAKIFVSPSIEDEFHRLIRSYRLFA